MKIPKKIKIGPHMFKVKMEKGAARNYNFLGQSRNDQCIIAIDPEQSISQIEDTILHEVLHLINAQVRFVEREEKTEEDAVSRLSPLLLQVLKDNPNLFD